LRSTISFNAGSGNRGGGIDAELGSSTNTFALINSTVAHNTLATGGLGAGVYVNSGGAGVTFTNDTFDLDAAGGTGSVFDLNNESAPTSIVNTIVLGGAEASCSRVPATSSAGHNLEDQNVCSFTQSGDKTMANPQLGALQNNAGPTDTQVPAASGPAIDAGGDAACPATDQRGVPRPQGAHCDIGAVENTTPTAGAPAVSNITASSATVSATISPVFLGGTFSYRYGPTISYGSSPPSMPLLAGAGAQPATASLTGLTPATTYHVQLVVTTPDGTATSSDVTFTTSAVPAPALSGLTLSPSAFRAASSGPTALTAGATAAKKKGKKTGTLISYRDSQAARTTFTVLQSQNGVRKGKRCVRAPKHPKRKAKRCQRLVSLGTFTHTDGAGPNRLRFTGRLRSKKLKPGRYKLRAIARSSAGKTGAPATKGFRIIR
jgi:hypothetical protein